MAEDEYSRAKIEEHSKRMDRHETLIDRLFSALDSVNRWRAKNTVYIVIGSALVTWVAVYLLQHYMDAFLTESGLIND